ncbi:hypothetical protein DFH09DRAFT_1499577 [Mycena vulgaris]|nr:hypothetical protein DFH09DRAFT_1499577 [Mycena vulgaris]
MHLLSTTVAVLAAATLASAVGTPTRRAMSFNPAPEDLVNDPATVSARAPQALTNAKRLALGMPPLKPRRRGGAARAANSPAVPIPQTCNIRAQGTDGTDFGFISPVWNGFGEYGTFQSAQDGALEVSFSYSADSSTQIGFTATNGPSATFPLMGAIDGFASDSPDFAVGSYNYAYLGGTTQSPPGSPPFSGASSFSTATGISERIESAIWSYDPKTQAITAQWVNTDGSMPATHIVYANDSNQALALTGDVSSFQNTFGAPYPEVTFVCVAPVISP